MADISQIQLPDGSTYDFKDSVARAQSGGAGGKGSWYGVCSTLASTAAKVVDVDGDDNDFELYTGVRVDVYFTNACAVEGATLNVSGTGAITIKPFGTTSATFNMWRPGEIVSFVYDGSYWVMSDGGFANTTYWGVTKLSNAVDSISDINAATSSAVKAVNDVAIAALPKSGGTMTGALTLFGAPTADLHAATKKYVDDNAGSIEDVTSLYWWRKYTIGYADEVTDALTQCTTSFYSSSLYAVKLHSASPTTKTKIEYSDSITVDQTTGAISLVSPSTYTVTTSTSTTVSTVDKKYIRISTRGTGCGFDSTSKIYYVNYSSSAIRGTSSGAWLIAYYGTSGTVSKRHLKDVNSIYSPGDFIENVSSSLRDSYTDYGVSNNYFYTYYGSVLDNQSVKVTTGTYIGTGTGSEDNPCIINFTSPPLLIWIQRVSFQITNTVPLQRIFYTGGLSSSYDWCKGIYVGVNSVESGTPTKVATTATGSTSYYMAKLVGTSLYMCYYGGSPSYSFNESGVTYNYFALTL